MIDPEARPADGYLLEEYTALEHILLGDLRDVLQEPSDEQTRHWMRVILDALLKTKQREFELQQDGGYLSEVLEQFPNWDGQVAQLRREHEELFLQLRDLRRRLDHPQAFVEIAETVRRELRDWMALLRAHQRRTRRIVQTAFNLDVGVGD